MKLFPKLALTVSTLLIGTTVCLSISFYFAERRSIRAEADQERRALVQNLVHITQESFLTNDDLLLVKYTRWLQKENPSLVSASVVSPQGEVLSHSEPSQIGKSVAVPRHSGSWDVRSACPHPARASGQSSGWPRRPPVFPKDNLRRPFRAACMNCSDASLSLPPERWRQDLSFHFFSLYPGHVPSENWLRRPNASVRENMT